MKCNECRESLVANAEGLLDPEESLQCRTHLETCAECRAEFAVITGLRQRLIEGGCRSTGVFMTDAVMRQIQAAPSNSPKATPMKTLFSGWKFPLSAAACVALLVTATLLLTPGSQARAAEVLVKGALVVARLSSIHLQCKMRSQANDNFVGIAPDQDFTSVEVWTQFGTNPKWRIEKPGRVAVMDGQSTVQYLKATNLAMKCGPSADAYDTKWLHQIADLSETINHELRSAKAHGWKLYLAKEQGAEGTGEKPESCATDRPSAKT